MNEIPVPPRPRPRRLLRSLIMLPVAIVLVDVAGALAARSWLVSRAPKPASVCEEFLADMAAGRWQSAARSATSEVAVGLETAGKSSPDPWGTSWNTLRVADHSGWNVGSAGVKLDDRTTVEYDVEGKDRKVRTISFELDGHIHPKIVAIRVDGAPVLPAPAN